MAITRRPYSRYPITEPDQTAAVDPLPSIKRERTNHPRKGVCRTETDEYKFLRLPHES